MSHLNVSRHAPKSRQRAVKLAQGIVHHVSYECVMSHSHESCHIYMSYVTYEYILSHMNESCHTWMCHVMHQKVGKSCQMGARHRKSVDSVRQSDARPRPPIYQVTWLNHTCDMTHSYSHVTFTWVMSHIHELCHIWIHLITYEWVMSHMNVSRHAPKSRKELSDGRKAS